VLTERLLPVLALVKVLVKVLVLVLVLVSPQAPLPFWTGNRNAVVSLWSEA